MRNVLESIFTLLLWEIGTSRTEVFFRNVAYFQVHKITIKNALSENLPTLRYNITDLYFAPK
jgi:hypothetical protein